MPELAELKIMQDYINQNVEEKKFSKLYHVEKGNIPKDSGLIEDFFVEANSWGKELKLKVYHDVTDLTFSIFMGMSGNWKFVKTENWNDTRFVRMRIDTYDGYSLLLYGSYMGPKYRLGGFTGVKRGPDPTKDFDNFKNNIIKNINSKSFDKPICEALLDQKYFNGIGAYLCSEIVGRLNINPFENSRKIIQNNPVIFDMCRDIPIESYNLGGGEIKDWINPFGKSHINNWLLFYGNEEKCYKQRFGARNIWINKIYKL